MVAWTAHAVRVAYDSSMQHVSYIMVAWSLCRVQWQHGAGIMSDADIIHNGGMEQVSYAMVAWSRYHTQWWHRERIMSDGRAGIIHNGGMNRPQLEAAHGIYPPVTAHSLRQHSKAPLEGAWSSHPARSHNQHTRAIVLTSPPAVLVPWTCRPFQ